MRALALKESFDALWQYESPRGALVSQKMVHPRHVQQTRAHEQIRRHIA